MLWPNAFTLAYAKLAADLAAELMRSGTTAAFHDLMAEPDAFDDLLRLPAWSQADDGGGSYKEIAFDRAA